VNKVVIYTRYSSVMQRMDSCADQERNVRRDLPRFGVVGDEVVVIRDEAESGTKTSRDGFQQLQAMIARAEVAILAVDDQSRLTRADNASAFVQDLVFSGGRFISTSEGIDTQKKGWELLVKALEMKNSATIRGLSDLVRRGQEGRVLCDGSAGDFPYGYESCYLDADWADQLARRGPKPKKGLRVCEEEARWIRQAFAWFVEGRAIGWIARELTRQGAPKGRRASTRGWHHEQVRRLLSNLKYVGRWAWGATTTLRSSQGRKKQVARPEGERVVRDRPDLRIVEQQTWEKAQRRLAELEEVFGMKAGQKKRGPKAHPSEVYPQSLLGGLLVCGRCGKKLWYQGSGQRRYYACPDRKKGLCDMTAQVPADRAEQALIGYLTDLLSAWPDWLRAVYQRTRELVQAAAEQLPAEQEQARKRLDEVRRQIGNLVGALADGTFASAAVKDTLAGLEREAEDLQRQLDGYAALLRSQVALPDNALLARELCRWAERLNGDVPQAASILRRALGSVASHAILAPGKKRGYVQLRFRVRGWDALREVLGDQLPEGVAAALAPAAEGGLSPEVQLDLGQPTEMDRWAAQIAAWRAEGVTWEEIARRTGLDLNRAFRAWKRITASQSEAPDPE
jgi:hypothetical protein